MAVDMKILKELREITQAGMMDCKKALEATNNDLDAAIVWLRENGLAKAAKKADRVAAEGIAFSIEDENAVVILEINSETDFVTQNNNFIKLVEEIANELLALPICNLENALSLMTKSGSTIADLLVNATATIGEKIELRRVFRLNKNENNTVVFYNHSKKRVSVALKFEGKMEHIDAYNVAMHVAAMSPKYKTQAEIPVEIKEMEMHIIKEQAKDDEKLTNKPANILEGILQGKLSKRLSEISLDDQDFVVVEGQKVGAFIKSKKVTLKEMIRFEVGEGIEKETVDFASEVAAQLSK